MIKTAWRYLLKDRQFTILNLLGLSSGLACTLLIWLWVNDELSVDRHNEKDERLYQVLTNSKTSDGIKTGEYTPGLLAEELKSTIPEIEYATTVLHASWFPHKGVLSYEDKHFKTGGDYVSADYFDVFSCRFAAGDKSRLFNDKMSVAISTDLAKLVFGTTQDIIGKTVTWDQGEFGGTFVISGVFEKSPSSSTHQFDLLFNFALVLERRPNLQNFANSDPHTYLLLRNGADLASLNKKINGFLQTKIKDTENSLFATRFSSQYLYGNYENGLQAGGRIAYVKLFSIIAAFIIIIACINFMNLSTAKASRRVKEVGIKKVVGARRESLIFQYIIESMLMAFLSLFVAVLIVSLALPVFNDITGKQLAFHYSVKELLVILSITLITGLAAGSYPALYLSGFKPAAVLKGNFSTSVMQVWIRKGLVVFQFSLSIIFIGAVLIVYRQLDFIQSKQLGYNRDNLIHFEIPLEMDSAKLQAAETFVKELGTIPGVVNASSYYHNLTGDHGGISGFDWPEKDPKTDIEFANLEVGTNFLETAGIRIVDGRNFSQNNNVRNEIVFNEKAIKSMGLKNPVGKTVRFWGMDKQIVGVAADFNFESLYEPVKPCFFQVYPIMPNVMVRIKSGAEKQTINDLQKAYASFIPGMDFDYKFLDEDYAALYLSEQKVSLLAQYFTGMAILISCLGLFGLTAFSAIRRQKEIGIRKVVGASVHQVSFLLSKEFLKLIFVAMIIAFPLISWAMNEWLNSFAYRIPITADVYLITGLAAIVITIVTISYHSIKAAMVNPVRSLRSE